MNQLKRTTKSVCPVCFQKIDAEIIENDKKVYLFKSCHIHGDFKLLLSNDAGYYLDLYDFYFDIVKDNNVQREFILHLTNKCNLNCSICMANANDYNDEYDITKLQKLLFRFECKTKIDIMGSEPTAREDLFSVINLIKKHGHTAALHTNGIKLQDYNYCLMLNNLKLDEVHLQYDTLNDDVNELIRGRKLYDIKEDAIKNLEKVNLSADIVMTILKNVNEKEIKDIFNKFSLKSFVKEIFFLGHRFLGKTHNNNTDTCMMPDEVLEYAIANSDMRLNRKNMKIFQKLYFTMLSVFSKRKCFYIHHYLYFRNADNIIPVDRLLNMNLLDSYLNQYNFLYKKNRLLAKLYILAVLPTVIKLSRYTFTFITSSVSYILGFIKTFNLAGLSTNFLLIGFITACDAYSYDEKISGNCGKGVISAIRGMNDNGAFDNLERDKFNI